MRGKWHGRPYHDIGTMKWLITFETEEAPEVFDRTRDKELSIEIKEHREKRSLSANAYFHVLCDKIAKVLNISAIEAKNTMLERYGQLDEEVPEIILRESIDWRKIEGLHLRPTCYTRRMANDKDYRIYFVVRGSHTYDTQEMSQLIEGTVQEAKELEIETLPPKELERMVATWKAY